MKLKSIFAIVSVAFVAGCVSYTDIAKFPKAPATDDGEKPIGAIEVTNVGYKLLCCIPICSGHVWQEDGVKYGECRAEGPRAWFEDECKLDENLKGVKRAIKEFPSNRVTNLVTYDDTWGWWSLFIVQRHIIRTSCTVLSK